MFKTTLVISALLGQISAIDIEKKKHSSNKSKLGKSKFSHINKKESAFLQEKRMDDFDFDDGDQYMAASIAEAEKEVDGRKTGKFQNLTAQIKQLEEESSMKPTQGGTQITGKMADDIASNALASLTNIKYEGGEVSVGTMDQLQKEIAQEQENKKVAIHNALHQTVQEMAKVQETAVKKQ